MRWNNEAIRRRSTIVLAGLAATVQLVALAAPDRMPRPQALAPLFLATIVLGMVHLAENRRLATHLATLRVLPPLSPVAIPKFLKVWTAFALVNAVVLIVWSVANYGVGRPIQVSDQAFSWEVDGTVIRAMTQQEYQHFWGVMSAVFAAVNQAIILSIGWRSNVVLLQLQRVESME